VLGAGKGPASAHATMAVVETRTAASSP
jgi:hypothetical protein